MTLQITFIIIHFLFPFTSILFFDTEEKTIPEGHKKGWMVIFVTLMFIGILEIISGIVYPNMYMIARGAALITGTLITRNRIKALEANR